MPLKAIWMLLILAFCEASSDHDDDWPRGRFRKGLISGRSGTKAAPLGESGSSGSSGEKAWSIESVRDGPDRPSRPPAPQLDRAAGKRSCGGEVARPRRGTPCCQPPPPLTALVRQGTRRPNSRGSGFQVLAPRPPDFRCDSTV